jgi:hypothetical protein
MKHNAYFEIAMALVLGSAGIPVGAQTASQNSSGSSLGEYARQVRKDPGVKAKPKVFDNDNLPREDKLSVVGQTTATVSSDSVDARAAASSSTAPAAGETKSSTPAPPATEAKPAAGEKTAATAAVSAKTPVDEAARQAGFKQWSDKIASQKQQIDLMARELDVLQREYQIRAAAMYADAGNRMRNSADWDKQDAQYKQQIADKQKAVDEAKQKLDDLQEDARKAGAPSSVSEQ